MTGPGVAKWIGCVGVPLELAATMLSSIACSKGAAMVSAALSPPATSTAAIPVMTLLRPADLNHDRDS